MMFVVYAYCYICLASHFNYCYSTERMITEIVEKIRSNVMCYIYRSKWWLRINVCTSIPLGLLYSIIHYRFIQVCDEKGVHSLLQRGRPHESEPL